MRLIALIIVLFTALTWPFLNFGQTVNAGYNFAYFNSELVQVTSVSITPLPPASGYTWPGSFLAHTFPVPGPMRYSVAANPSMTNGTLVVSNLWTGYPYQIEISDVYGDYFFTNYFETNLPSTGIIDASTNQAFVFGAIILPRGANGTAFTNLATINTPGIVQPDNVGVTVDGNGVLHVIGGGGTNAVTIGTNTDGTASVVNTNISGQPTFIVSVPTNKMATVQAAGDLANQAAGQAVPSYYGPGTFPVSSNGAVADLVELDDVTATSGSPIVSAPDGNFTSALVGKHILIFNDTTNATYSMGTISSVQSTTQLTMSVNAGANWTSNGTVVFGSDNTAAFQATANQVYTNGGGTFLLQNGGYLLASAPIIRTNAQNEDSVINFPCNFIRQSPTNKQPTIVISGLIPGYNSYSTQTNRPSMSGAIIYQFPTATLPNTSTNINCIFGFNCDATNYGLGNLVVKNVTMRKVRGTAFCDIFSPWGGNLAVEDAGFDVDFPAWDYETTHYDCQYQPINSVTNPWTDTAIWTPGVDNSAKVKIENVTVYNYGCGIEAGEHTHIKNCNIEWCGTSLSYFTSMPTYGANVNTAGVTIDGLQLLGGAIQMSDWAGVNTSDNINFSANGIDFDDMPGRTLLDIHDYTGTNLRGVMSYTGMGNGFPFYSTNSLYYTNSLYPSKLPKYIVSLYRGSDNYPAELFVGGGGPPSGGNYAGGIGSTYFWGNAGGLTNIPATQLNGTIPSGNLGNADIAGTAQAATNGLVQAGLWDASGAAQKATNGLVTANLWDQNGAAQSATNAIVLSAKNASGTGTAMQTNDSRSVNLSAPFNTVSGIVLTNGVYTLYGTGSNSYVGEGFPTPWNDFNGAVFTYDSADSIPGTYYWQATVGSSNLWLSFGTAYWTGQNGFATWAISSNLTITASTQTLWEDPAGYTNLLPNTFNWSSPGHTYAQTIYFLAPDAGTANPDFNGNLSGNFQGNISGYIAGILSGSIASVTNVPGFLTPPASYPSSPYTIAADGDSVTQTNTCYHGPGWFFNFTTINQLNHPFQNNAMYFDFAACGQQLSSLTNRYPANGHLISPAITGNPGYYLIHTSDNDYNNGTTTNQFISEYSNLLVTLKADGWKTIVINTWSNAWFAAGQNTNWMIPVNQWLLSQSNLYTAYVDAGSFFQTNQNLIMQGPHPTSGVFGSPTPCGSVSLALLVSQALTWQMTYWKPSDAPLTNSLLIAATPNFNFPRSDYSSATAFTWQPPLNVNASTYPQTAITVKNTGGSLYAMTPAAGWNPIGTWNVTNGGYTIVSIEVDPVTGATNAFALPEK